MLNINEKNIIKDDIDIKRDMNINVRVAVFINFFSAVSKYRVCFWDKRKKMKEQEMDIDELKNDICRVSKSKLLIFDTTQKSKKLLLEGLKIIDTQRKHYSPVVQVGKTSVYYFPLLDYRDLSLLQKLFEDNFIGQSFSIGLSKCTD